MAHIYISIGSNIEPHNYIRAALTALRENFSDLICSSVYQSKAVGFEGDDFLNLVVAATTDKSVDEVVELIHQIEDQNGRNRHAAKFSARTLDLDLLLYDDLILSKSKLQIPRDEITKNAFVLLPLSEIAPDLKHPVLKTTMRDLWNGFDQSSQQLHAIEFQCA